MRTPRRQRGYAPIQDYAVIGNKRTAALVALDGTIDWMCMPRFDSPSVFGALLDPERGGSFALAPAVPYEAERSYREGTNILETTFRTADGVVRVTDFMSVGLARPVSWNEVVRRVDGLSGSVLMEWRVEPRFDFRGELAAAEHEGDRLLLKHGRTTLALQSFDAGEPEASDGGASGRFAAAEGGSGLLVLSGFEDKPVLVPTRDDLGRRLEAARLYWQRWTEAVEYDGAWREAVIRSALMLELMVHEPDASMVAALTTSLPEQIGGRRNYDYRYTWVRDTTFAMDALLRLGLLDAVHASLTWLLHTTSRTHPRIHTFYGLDGRVHDETRELDDWAGYRGSKPVVLGNSAGGQLQLGNFGDLMQTTWLFVCAGNRLDNQSALRLAEAVDLLCDLWRKRDSCIWELDEQRNYTQSKMSSWLAFERAIELVRRGELPAAHLDRWRTEREALRDYIDTACFDQRRGVWKRDADSEELDAAVLLIAGMDYVPADDARLHATIDAIRDELGHGPLIYRYSGMEDQEGCFLPCSFWLVEALARTGRVDEAEELMEQLVPMANDVGLYAEELDPASGDMLGNFPQALTHLSLINGAFAIAEARRRENPG